MITRSASLLPLLGLALAFVACGAHSTESDDDSSGGVGADGGKGGSGGRTTGGSAGKPASSGGKGGSGATGGSAGRTNGGRGGTGGGTTAGEGGSPDTGGTSGSGGAGGKGGSAGKGGTGGAGAQAGASQGGDTSSAGAGGEGTSGDVIVIDFEGVTDNMPLPASYAGLTWDYDWFTYHPLDKLYLAHSGTEFITNLNAPSPLGFTFPEPVRFKGAWFSHYSGATVQFEAFDANGDSLGMSPVLTQQLEPKFLAFDVPGVKRVAVSWVGDFAMDDVTYAP